MHEVISVQIGQCGNQLGNEFWRKIAAEHHISEEGFSSVPMADRRDRFFYQTDDGRFVPRAMLIDLEPRVVSQCLPFFNSDNVFLSNEGGGAGNNWAHGYYVARKVREGISDMMQREAEACDSLESVYMMHSTAGGTGSGFGSFLLAELRDLFPKKIVSAYSILPANEESSDVVVQPYNSVLTLHHLHSHCDSVTLMDNYALGCIAMDSVRVRSPSFNIINSLAASVVSFSNATIRFPGHIFCDSRSILNCTVPVPGFNFLIPSFTPFNPEELKRVVRKITTSDVMRRLLLPKTRLATYDSSSLHSSISLFNILEGVESTAEVSRTAELLLNKGHASFVPWMPPFYQVAISKKPPAFPRVTGLALNNTTGVASLLKKISQQFDLLRGRNAFIEIYKKFDTDLGIFDECRETVQRIADSYEECELKEPLPRVENE